MNLRFHLPVILGVAALLGLGISGYTGSSFSAEAGRDPLLSPGQRADPSIFGRARGIRGDEFDVELPDQRAQQRALPPFSDVNSRIGLGQMERSPSAAPVIGWGMVFRPTTWPLLLGSRWSLGVRWFLRCALLLLGLYAWVRTLSASPSERAAEQRWSAALAGLCATALFFCSAFAWWLSTPITEMVAFAGIGVACFGERARAETMHRRVGWLVFGGAALACAFFNFYPPIWAPVLWLVCASSLDLELRRDVGWRRAIQGWFPIALATAGAVIASILYYAPYLALVRDTVYPGSRVTAAGELAPSRLLGLLWPSLYAVAPPNAAERYLGSIPGLNVCEVSPVEVLPLVPLLVLLVLDADVRRALRRSIARSPALTGASLVVGCYLLLPMPRWFTTLSLMRWSPANRAFVFWCLGIGLLVACWVIEVARVPVGSRRLQSAFFVLLTVCAGYALAQRDVPVRLSGNPFWRHLLPVAGFASFAAWAASSGGRRRSLMLSAAWCLPLAWANHAVNPLVPSATLFREGVGHLVVERALAEEPGRIVHYSTHGANYLRGFGWPVLFGVQLAPDRDLFRFLAEETPGLTRDVYDRYAHVYAILPPDPVRLLQQDAFVMPVSPCSARVATLGVNHFLLGPSADFPEECRTSFRSARAGDAVLWSRRAPVSALGVARLEEPRSALDFDFSPITDGPGVRQARNGFEVWVPAGMTRVVAFAANRSVLQGASCVNATAGELDAHVTVRPASSTGGKCFFRYLDTAGALRRLAHR